LQIAGTTYRCAVVLQIAGTAYCVRCTFANCRYDVPLRYGFTNCPTTYCFSVVASYNLHTVGSVTVLYFFAYSHLSASWVNVSSPANC
jgi:hypothetical protein